MDAELQDKLASEVDLTTWRDLRSHAARDVLFLVQSASLTEVGLAIAQDDADQVAAFISSGQLTRPTAEQLTEYERELGKTFHCLIVTPFVLATEVQVVAN